jgi:hypothetical protein
VQEYNAVAPNEPVVEKRGDPPALHYHLGIRAVAARVARHPHFQSLVVGVVIGCAVCLPLFGDRPVFLLDWATGPHTRVVSPGLLGLNGGLTTGAVASAGVVAVGRVVGPAVTWLVMLAIFPLATVAAGRLTGGSRGARLAAGTLYAVNPFVFNRLYVGHLALLVGYALLPFATISALEAPARRGARMLTPALWWAVLTASSPHFAWIYGVVVLAAAVAHWHEGLRALGWLLCSAAAFAVMSTYVLLPHTATQLPSQAGPASLAIYRTTGDPHLGLFVNVLGLYGFWRTGPGPQLPKDVVAGWPLLLGAILVVAAAGAWGALRRRPDQPDAGATVPVNPRSRRPTAVLLLIAGAAGYFLALGDQGPTGALFSWAYYHVPFFQVMREPQKFVMLLALAYPVFFGWGVERFSRAVSSRPRAERARIAAGVAGAVLPLAYCPTVFWGLAGQISPSTLPASYARADRLVGAGPGAVLYLPWHLYMYYPFTGRVVANVAPNSFRREVISGDDVELGRVETQSSSPRSAYIQALLPLGKRLGRFGALVAPLGVQYVVLAKTVDWASYGWLDHQRDLRLAYDSSSLEVWRNEDYSGLGARVAQPETVTNLQALVRRAEASGPNGPEGLNGGAVTLSSSQVPPRGDHPEADGTDPDGEPQVRELSPVAYQVPAGSPGWVSVDVPYQEGWTLDGKAAVPTAEGTMMFRAGPAGGVVKFEPWGLVKLGYVLSGGTFLVLAVGIALGRRTLPARTALARQQ